MIEEIMDKMANDETFKEITTAAENGLRWLFANGYKQAEWRMTQEKYAEFDALPLERKIEKLKRMLNYGCMTMTVWGLEERVYDVISLLLKYMVEEKNGKILQN